MGCDGMVVNIKGYISEDGQLIVELPQDSGFAAGDEVEITVRAVTEETSPDEDVTWTEEELAEMLALLTPNPKTGKQIAVSGAVGAWSDEDITSGAAWVEEQRRKRRERHQW